MSLSVKARRVEPHFVVGPNGERLSLQDLPPPDTRRWVIRRKAEVISAVRGGLMTRDEALARWALSEEELDSWGLAFERHGLAGLRTTQRSV
jgi:hypothetical protein